MEDVLWYPTFELHGKRLIILNGFKKCSADDRIITVVDEAKLQASAAKYSDAIAFAYFRGRWVPAI